MRSPDAPADAFARLEDRDVVPVDGEVPRRRQPGDASADHQDLSRRGAHVPPSLDRLHLPWPRSLVARTLSYLMGIKIKGEVFPSRQAKFINMTEGKSSIRALSRLCCGLKAKVLRVRRSIHT